MKLVTILQKLTAFAASQGKGLDQLTQALLDAGNGEFERLKEFGIQVVRMTVDGQVYIRHQGALHTLANTPDALSAFILDLPAIYSMAEMADQAWQLKQQLKLTPLEKSAEAGFLETGLRSLRFTVDEMLKALNGL